MTTIARPYAIAAFEYALAENALPAWETMLSVAADVSQDALTQQLLMSPDVTSTQLVELYNDVLKGVLTPHTTNFIHLLAENHRLAALPEIYDLFVSYRAAQEKTVTVNVRSAVALDAPYLKKLTEALKKRLQHEVVLQCSVDESLLGGAVICAGDTVIDGSVRGKLNRMIEFIS